MEVAKAIWRYAAIPAKRMRKSKGKPPAFFFGFPPWKAYIKSWQPNYITKRAPHNLSRLAFVAKWRPWMMWDRRSEAYVWGYKEPCFVRQFCKKHGIPIVRVEDGFLRSVQLGAEKAPPISLCFDRSGSLYYDATRESDLERLIQTYDFDADRDLMERARNGIAKIIETRVSKYNVSNDFDPLTLYGEKTRKRVLVVGQVEGDMSMILGCERPIDNNTFVWMVARQNPDADIIYKPHPEVLRGLRKDPPQSDPWDVSGVARVLIEDVTLADAFQTIDHVYTMTSLSGFEALIRGIPVTCYGMPFYAGWGATTDMQACPRRTARRTVAEIFAAAYILYPTYFDPIAGKHISFEEALDLLTWMRDRKPLPRPVGTAE
jgi:Capsule polysaccharide export protein